MASNHFSWTSEEDQALTSLVSQNGEKKWCTIATLINEQIPDSNKTGKQCRERWHNHLDPALIKDGFTLQDEIKVFELQRQHGNKWSLIAEHFHGRNDNFIKNCFYSAIRRNLRKYNRKKVPSKQLKGTINTLLRNPHTRKILMTFPEHEHPESFIEKFQKKKEVKPESKMPNLRVSVPPKGEPAFKPVRRQSIQRRDLGDITPTLFANMALGIIPEDYESQDFYIATPTALISTDAGKTEPPSAYQVILPDYCLQNNFQFYVSPRNSQ